MAYDANNPIQRLMDVDTPEIKRANWNCDYSIVTTASPLFVNVVHTDHILPHTRVQFDIDQASFANPTISPLYGRFRVKYIAYFAPYRLYMKEWRNNETTAFSELAPASNETPFSYPVLSIPPHNTTDPSQYVPPTSLGEQLGVYPAYFQNSDWNIADSPDPSTSFSFLAFWDFFRHYLANQQDPDFYVRTHAYYPSWISDGVTNAAVPIQDTTCSRSKLNSFFDDVISHSTATPLDVRRLWIGHFGFDPIFVNKDVSTRTLPGHTLPSKFVNHQFHYGLPICPYLPDPFTSWISNENVELERSSSKMIVNNGELTMDQWRIANATQIKLRKYLFNLGDFSDMIDAQYGIKPSTQISKPMFLGAFVSDIVFNDVVSTAQTGDTGIVEDNQTLGSRAGYGRGTDRGKQNFVDFTAQEFGVFQIIQIIEPETFYYEGRDLQYTTHRYDEEFNPTFNIGLLQDLQKQQLNLVPNLAQSPTGTDVSTRFNFSEFNTSLGKQPYGMEHITKTNRLKGMMTMPEYYQGWSLGRSFNHVRDTSYQFSLSNRNLYSSYGFPEMYNNIFANSQNIDNFQFYLSFNYTKYNVVLKKFIPFV